MRHQFYEIHLIMVIIMNIERQIVVEVVGNILVSDLSLNAVDIINRMHELILIHGDSVFLDIDDEGCYSGFYQYNICIRREQTVDEYQQMLTELELRERSANQTEIHRLIERSINGRRLTRSEIAFLNQNGIILNR